MSTSIILHSFWNGIIAQNAIGQMGREREGKYKGSELYWPEHYVLLMLGVE